MTTLGTGGTQGRDSTTKIYKPGLSGEAGITRGLPGSSSGHRNRKEHSFPHSVLISSPWTCYDLFSPA